jgi:hypothetical protein
MNLIKRIFFNKRKKNTEANNKVARDGLDEIMRSIAWMSEIPVGVLTPAVPLPAKDAAGWFGGAPRLPKELAWPEIDGTPLCFLAQIDLTQVPQNIWSGLGPRQGQLAFFIHPHDLKAKALHIDGVTEKRAGPSPVSSDWFLKHYDNSPPASTYFPEWPVRLTATNGHLPHPMGRRKGYAADHPNPYENEPLDLTLRAHHPFDKATLKALVEQFDDALKRVLSSIAFFLETKKLRKNVTLALRAFQVELESSHKRFSEIKERLVPYYEAFDRDAIGPYMEALSDLFCGKLTYLRNDDQEYAEFDISVSKLTSCAPYYLHVLERHARYTYLISPEILTSEARTRFETIWAFDAAYEQGCIAGPGDVMHRDMGPSSPNEALLELPTSDLIGWIWGDCYHVVLSIARDDLANGKLDNIMVDITN